MWLHETIPLTVSDNINKQVEPGLVTHCWDAQGERGRLIRGARMGGLI